MPNMPADRYRAYAETEVQDRRAAGPRTVEEIAFSGDTDGTAAAKFDAGSTTISKVVFYAGPVESETVVGSVASGQSGKINVELAAEE